MDVASRISNRMQLTTDGHKVYPDAVEDAFGSEIDHAMLVKIYGASNDNPESPYSPATCIGWVPHLHQAFPHLQKPDRKTVFNRFDNVRLLRNRIAHQEKIVTRNLAKDYWEIIETLGWICPTTASWVLATATFPREYSK